MKIKQIIKILETVDGFVPSDMKELDNVLYESKSQGKDYSIEDMDFVHFIRAFIKYNTQLNEEVRRDTQEGAVAELTQEIEYLTERNQDLHKRLEEKSYREVTAPRYVFSEIPNDCDGQRFVDDARKYFNRSRYKMRVLGQHVKDEYKGTGATAYGQNIQQSTHLRVYIEEK
tara:strand:+ start:1439 stop:1954 length:516 start_codon:yes stop_codon:yes gene_type:complete